MTRGHRCRRGRRARRQVVGPVPDDDDVPDVDAEHPQLLGQPRPVAVGDPAGQHLGARDDDPARAAHGLTLGAAPRPGRLRGAPRARGYRARRRPPRSRERARRTREHVVRRATAHGPRVPASRRPRRSPSSRPPAPDAHGAPRYLPHPGADGARARSARTHSPPGRSTSSPASPAPAPRRRPRRRPRLPRRPRRRPRYHRPPPPRRADAPGWPTAWSPSRRREAVGQPGAADRSALVGARPRRAGRRPARVGLLLRFGTRVLLVRGAAVVGLRDALRRARPCGVRGLLCAGQPAAVGRRLADRRRRGWSACRCSGCSSCCRSSPATAASCSPPRWAAWARRSGSGPAARTDREVRLGASRAGRSPVAGGGAVASSPRRSCSVRASTTSTSRASWPRRRVGHRGSPTAAAGARRRRPTSSPSAAGPALAAPEAVAVHPRR